MSDFRNETRLNFLDISSESQRVYNFGGGTLVKIERPLKLHVSESGGHRLFDSNGMSHYVPPRWVQLSWAVREDAPHFSI